MESISTKAANFCTKQSGKSDFYRMALIVIAGVLIYSNTLSSPFLFDDSANIVNNAQIKDLSLSGLMDTFYTRRAIGIITFRLNYYLSGWNVLGYHITNIFIHIASSLAVYRLLQLLVNAEIVSGNADARFRGQPLPFFAALLFAVHPVQTQTITYIVQRYASLATLFYLAAIISFLNARLHQSGTGRFITGRAAAWFSAALFSGFLAFNTKEIAFTLPIAIILVELLFFRCSPKKIFWLILASATTLVALFMKYASTAQSVQDALSAVDQATRLQTITSRTDYLLTQFRVIMTYLRLLFLPVNQSLDYDFTLSHSFTEWRVYCSFFVLSALMLTAFWLLRKSSKVSPYPKLIAFGIFWFFLTLSVESSIIPIIDLIFEHRLYLPLFGAVTAVSSVIMMVAWKNEAAGKAVCVGFLLISLVLALTAYNRNRAWSSEVSIWADAVNKSSDSARAWNNLGGAHIKQRDSLSALKAIIRSIELDPSKADAWNNLGIAIDIMGAYNDRFKRTTEMFRNPGSVESNIVNRWLADVNNNLGLSYEIVGNLKRAAESYSNAIGYNPSLGLAYYNLGIVSAKKGDVSKYSEQLQILRMIDPILAERLQHRVATR